MENITNDIKFINANVRSYRLKKSCCGLPVFVCAPIFDFLFGSFVHIGNKSTYYVHLAAMHLPMILKFFENSDKKITFVSLVFYIKQFHRLIIF